jgi:hypothetical protein
MHQLFLLRWSPRHNHNLVGYSSSEIISAAESDDAQEKEEDCAVSAIAAALPDEEIL